MVRLINADEMLKRLESWNTDDEMDKALYNFTLSRIIEQSTVDAIPIEFIQKRINLLHEMAEYDFEANGGYIGEAHVAEYELENLLTDWRTEQEKQNEPKENLS